MYFLFRYKKWNPMKYYEMGYGEKRILHAFMLQEIEDYNEEQEELRRKYEQ